VVALENQSSMLMRLLLLDLGAALREMGQLCALLLLSRTLSGSSTTATLQRLRLLCGLSFKMTCPMLHNTGR
jgi:hypothetical protein